MERTVLKAEKSSMGHRKFKRAAGIVFAAAALAGAAMPAAPVNAAAGTQEFTSDGSATVAVTAEVPDRVTADYTVVLPTEASLAYNADAGSFTGVLKAGVYGSIDERHAVYTKIATDTAAPVDKDASGNFKDAAPDGSKDTATKITRWYKLTDAGTGGVAYLTAEQDAGKGCTMKWVDAGLSGSLAGGEARMAPDSAGLNSVQIAALSADPQAEGSYAGSVMVAFGTVKR